MIHLTLAMVLSPLLFVKVLVARYYKSYYSLLMPIGLVIFVRSFVLIGITAGPYLAHQTRMQTVSLAAIDLPPAGIDINLAGRTVLTGLGVNPERIRQESFGNTVPKSPQQGFAAQTDLVEFVRSGKTCMVRSGQTLLEAAEEQGVPIPSSCRQGQCGTCKTKLLEGDVRMDAEEGLDPDSRAQGFVLTCVGHAHGAVKLDA